MLVRLLAFAAVVLLSEVAASQAATDAEKCEAARLKLAGKYAQCLLGAEAKGILKDEIADFTKCSTKYDEKCAAILAKYGAECPLPADCASIKVIHHDHDAAALRRRSRCRRRRRRRDRKRRRLRRLRRARESGGV
jgi:hypothetical protein